MRLLFNISSNNEDISII